MRSTEIDRRTFLALAGAAALAPQAAYSQAQDDEPLYLGARLNGTRHEVAVIDAMARDRLVLPMAGRGHSFAVDAARRRAVAFARRPGRFAVAFDVDGRDEPVAIAPPADRHFFGHGIFTPDGRLMIATENDFDGARGVAGIYDATDGFARIGEFPTDGVGPHEVVLMPDGRTLCIANGGILTHPDYERVKLNVATMEPGIVYLDAATGEIVEKAGLAPDLHRLSIRHMSVDAAGNIWFGCQYEGDPADTPPLVGRHRRGREIELFPAPEKTLRAMRNYVGSLAVDTSGEMLAASAPRGGLVTFWDTATGRFLGTRAIADGCGVAPAGPESVLATSGRGEIVETGPSTAKTLRHANGVLPQWDNHLRRMG